MDFTNDYIFNSVIQCYLNRILVGMKLNALKKLLKRVNKTELKSC